MKIITPGILPEKRLPFWVGKKLTCQNCRAVIELELADESQIKTTQTRGMHYCATVETGCPTPECGASIFQKYQPDGRGGWMEVR